jgi:hypothetical protein
MSTSRTRTKIPTLTNGSRRLAVSQRIIWGVTPSRSAASSIVSNCPKHSLGQSTTQAAEIYMLSSADLSRRIADRMDEVVHEPSNVRLFQRTAVHEPWGPSKSLEVLKDPGRRCREAHQRGDG